MAKQLSSNPNTALIEGARSLGLSNMPIDTTAAQKAIGQSFERVQKYAIQKSEERVKRIKDIQTNVSRYRDKFPVETNLKVPSNYQDTNDQWLRTQRSMYLDLADKAANTPQGSDERYEYERGMEKIKAAIKNNSAQWDAYIEAKKEDSEDFIGQDFSKANDPNDLAYIGSLQIDKARIALPDSNGNLQFYREESGEIQLWNKRPDLNVISSIARKALGAEAERIIRKGQKLDDVNSAEVKDALLQIIDENPNALYSLASDNLFGGYSEQVGANEPIPGGWEMSQEPGGQEKLKALVVEKYMGHFKTIADKAYEAKQRRNAEITGVTTEFIFDPKTDARISYAESQLINGDVPIVKGTSLNLTGEAREWDLAWKDGQLIVSDPKGGVLKDVNSFEALRERSEQMQKLK
jgi:hypothetical protein